MTNQICPADDTDDPYAELRAFFTKSQYTQLAQLAAYIAGMAMEDHSSETKEQYDARIKEKIERRAKLGEELANMASKKKAEEAKEQHWTDKIKPWPGAHGSYYMLKL